MIPPRNQIIHQICVTSLCWPKTPDGQLTQCSNCTRLLGHERKRYIMEPNQFEKCVEVAKDFVYNSPSCPHGRNRKIIGIFGGEPLMSPFFPEYVEILCKHIPESKHRGLWTSVDWQTYKSNYYGQAKSHVEKLLGDKGFLNWNMHEVTNKCEHHPILVAIKDVIKDEEQMWSLINNCWLNRDWSACYALNHNNEPKFYFCEIASSFDRVFNLDIGLEVIPNVWNHDLWFENNRPQGVYAPQIFVSCTRCGQALPLKQGRRDLEYKDDVSPSNLKLLEIAKSPMIKRGDIEVITEYQQPINPHYPGQYIKEGKTLSSRL